MPTCDMKRFQGIFQICANCCIPASIENIIRYHGSDLSQRKFLDNFLSQYNMTDLHFQKVKEFLDNNPFFTIQFECEHKTIKEHKNKSGLLSHIGQCISKDLPIIVALKQETQDSVNRHIVTVYYIDNKNISYFDSNPNTGGFKEFKPIEEFAKLLSDNLGTLLIKKNLKL